jgi:hypothetical protein
MDIKQQYLKNKLGMVDVEPVELTNTNLHINKEEYFFVIDERMTL